MSGRSLTVACKNQDRCAGRIGMTDRDAHTRGSEHGDYVSSPSVLTGVQNAPAPALERNFVKLATLLIEAIVVSWKCPAASLTTFDGW
jgi:hypothetical protein